MPDLKKAFREQVVNELTGKSPAEMQIALDSLLGAFNRSMISTGSSSVTIDMLGFKQGKSPLAIGRHSNNGKSWWHHNPVADNEGKVWNVLPIQRLSIAERIVPSATDGIPFAAYSTLLTGATAGTVFFAAAGYNTGTIPPYLLAGASALATVATLYTGNGLEHIAYKYRNAAAHARSSTIALGFASSAHNDNPEKPYVFGRVDNIQLVKLG